MLPTFVRATPDGTGEARLLLRGRNCHDLHVCVPRFSDSILSMWLLAEKGDFLALDLGGTNFRVLHVRMVEEEQRVLKMDSQICTISKEMMLGTGQQVSRRYYRLFYCHKMKPIPKTCQNCEPAVRPHRSVSE